LIKTLNLKNRRTIPRRSKTWRKLIHKSDALRGH
jgi:hypothetical protein